MPEAHAYQDSGVTILVSKEGDQVLLRAVDSRGGLALTMRDDVVVWLIKTLQAMRGKSTTV